MAVKSIIEIEVDDGHFNDFKVAFDKYQKALNESPAAWAKVGKAAAAATQSLADQQEKFNKHAKSSESSMVRMAKHTKTMVGDIKSATESLLKWSGIVATISGLIGAGGLFGIDRLAASASNSRFRAMGLGVSTAELNSANVNYSRAVGDPSATMGAIRDAQYDLSKRWAFSAMGVNPAGKDAGQLIGPMIKAARASFIASGGTQQGAEAHGLTQFFSMDDLVRFKSMSTAEIDAMIKRADADKKALVLSDSASRSWQDLKIQLDRAETQIGNTFIKGLLPLTGPLTQLSAAFTQAVADVMKSKEMGAWLQGASDGIRDFAKYITSPDFKHDVSGFMESLDELAGAIWDSAKTIGKMLNFGGDSTSLKFSQYRQLDALAKVSTRLASAVEYQLQHPNEKAYDSQGRLITNSAPVETSLMWNWYDKQHGATDRATVRAMLRGLGISMPGVSPTPQRATTTSAAAAWSGSSRHNPGNLRTAPGYPSVGGFAVFPDDAAGVRAMAAQLRRYGAHGENSIDSIINRYAPASDNNATGAYIRDVVRQTGYAPGAQLDMNDPKTLANLIAAMTKHEGSKAHFTPSSVITIMNNTGGNTYATANQLAH
jgi:hypothetical protein